MNREADLWLSRRLSRLQTDPDGSFLPVELLPTERDIATLKGRVDKLSAALSPSPRADVARIVANLLRAFPSRAGSYAGVSEMLETYVFALSEFPLWAIAKVAQDWTRGQCEGQSPEFAPTPAQWSILCEKAVEGIREERGKIEALVHAKPLPAPKAEMRREVIDDLAKSWRIPEPDEIKPAFVDDRRLFEKSVKEGGAMTNISISASLKRSLEEMGAPFPEKAQETA